MINVEFTREEISTEFAGVTSLGEVLKKIEAQLFSKGHMVCRFKVNGLILTEADESRMASTDLSEVDILQVESRSQDEIVRGVIGNWIEELPALIKKSDRLGQDIKFSGIEGQLKSFTQLIDTCQFLVESLLSLENVIGLDEKLLEAWQHNERLTTVTVGEALKAFEKKDFVMLAEIFEYDLGHMLQIWLEFLKEINQNLINEHKPEPALP